MKNDGPALSSYRAVYEGVPSIGGSDEFGAVQGAARVLVRQGKTDEALAELARIDTGTIGGTWRHSTWLARAEVHAAAGRKAEAIALCREVLADETAEKRHREAAAAKLKEWE